jgi:adenosylcobinamide-phosphate guanylyltransferase
MCGGRGTRLDASVEKPLLEIGGVPMIDRVIDALKDSDVETIAAVGSPATPRTLEHVDQPVIEGAGEGYVADLDAARAEVDLPVLTLGADLPLLSAAGVNWVLDADEGGSAMVAVPVERKRELGLSVDTTMTHDGEQVAPSGVNVVGDPSTEATLMTARTEFAVNVNRPRDAQIAEALLDGR